MGNAQNSRVMNTDISPYSNSYWELNAGVYTEEYFTFPGASFLWGKTHYYKNNTFHRSVGTILDITDQHKYVKDKELPWSQLVFISNKNINSFLFISYLH